MTNEQLREWVADPTRTQHELQVAAHGLGLPWHGATRGQLIALILGHLSALPAGGPATWSPAPPAPTAAAPAPAAPAAGAVTPPPPPAPAPAPAFPAWVAALVGVGTVALIAIVGLLALLAFRPAATPAPTAQAQAQAAAPAPQAQAAPAAAPAPAAPSATPSGLSAAEVQTVLNASARSDGNPGGTIQALDALFERSDGNVRSASTAPGGTVQAGQLVWTNWLGDPPSGVAPVRAQGGWGVFAVCNSQTNAPNGYRGIKADLSAYCR